VEVGPCVGGSGIIVNGALICDGNVTIGPNLIINFAPSTITSVCQQQPL
jgi:hypothetical protein